MNINLPDDVSGYCPNVTTPRKWRRRRKKKKKKKSGGGESSGVNGDINKMIESNK